MNTGTLGAALAMGLLGSTHCAAMCGGIVGLMNAGMPVQLRARPVRQLPLALGYNLGRIVSYASAGLVAGGAGAYAGAAVPVHRGQYALQAFAALFTLALGLHLAGLFRGFARLERLGAPVWSRVAPLVKSLLPMRTLSHAVGVGLLWGWMPCGMVYSALVLAMGAGSAVGGALTMTAFGLGTLPTLLALGAAAGVVARAVRLPRVRRAAGLALGAVGLLGLLSSAHTLARPASEGGAQLHCHGEIAAVDR